jgi:hypothetical protein
MKEAQLASVEPTPGGRWRFVRDVVVFQLKMLVSNVRDFALMPVSLGAAVLDLISRGEREGALFYRVLQWGAHSEKMIDVYSAIEDEAVTPSTPKYSIDAAVAQIEGVIVRECEKGGTAATIRAAMDRAIDQLHRETSGPRAKATELVTRAGEKLRGQFDRTDSSAPPPKLE